MDADALQMSCVEEKLQAASQICSQMFELGDALRQHMVPCQGWPSFSWY